ncbi:MAG: GumC family protein, partial [Planctomycetota bacterium]
MPESQQNGLVPAGQAVPSAEQMTVWSSYGHTGATGVPGAVPVGGDEGGQSLWAMIDDRLQGRWRWSVMLAALLGTALAVLGWRSTVPKYESIGVIRVVSTAPITLEGIPEGQVGNFSMFVNTQVERLKSRRVLENAMKDEELAALDWTSEPGRLGQLEDDIVVAGDRNSELIYVSYESQDPVVAQTVVNAVIRSYDEIYGQQADGNVINRKLEDLQVLESQFQRELNRARADIMTITERHGMDPAEMQRMNLEQLNVIEELIFAAERALRNASAAGQETPSAEDVLAPPQILNRLEQIDAELAVRRRVRDEKQARFDEISQHYRRTASAYQIARRDAETAQRMFETQYARALETWEQSRFNLVPGNVVEGDYEGWPSEALRDEIQALTTRQHEIVGENQDLLADIQQLQDKREQEQTVKNNLERTKQRIAGLLREEKNVSNRISIEQQGYRPLDPSSDGRVKRAAVGMMLGGAMSFGLFFLIGTIDRRTFGIDQLRHEGVGGLPPVLGVLPDLRHGELNPETSDVAAHCVHQIRNQVEARRQEGRGYVLVVTSPFQGDGKTSIVLALGWSYAVAGYRCLVVDCDLVGRSLTRQVGMSGSEGLKEAAVTGEVGERITRLPVENLSVLPVGRDPRFGPEAVRKDILDRVLRQVRERYDIVVVDTGPLLGALETTPAAAVADGVVLSVRRGRSRSRLEESVARLTSVGARCLGVILNCATKADCYRSVSEASLSAD